MATPQSALEKYRAKTGTSGVEAWNAAKGRMKANYSSGLARFAGRPPLGHIVSAYNAGIDRATYRGGDPDKWFRNYMAKVFGG